MKRKDYDDDLLVEMLARDDRTYARIAADVGIRESAAAYIGSGRYRRDLHPRIRAAAEKLPPELRRPGPWWPEAREGRPRSGKVKDYDDDLMVELIARGELSYKEISRRLGVSLSAVARIASGETRPDLQDRINTAMRRHLAQRRRHPARTVRRLVECEKPGLAPKRKDYDDNLLVDMIARGDQTYESIARDLGISRAAVRRIASGGMRPELQPRIAAAARAHRDQAHRMGAKWMWGLLARHIRSGIEGDGEAARKCREFVLKFIEDYGRFGDVPPPAPEPIRGLSDLSTDLQKRILDELGVEYDDSWSVDQTTEAELENQ